MYNICILIICLLFICYFYNKEQFSQCKVNQNLYKIKPFRCPISDEIMIDPVIASDGLTYERKNIQTHIDLKIKSKFNNKILSNNLIPDSKLKNYINNHILKTNKSLNKSSNQLSNLNIKKNNNHPSYHLDEPILKNNNIDIWLNKIKKESMKTTKKLDIVQNNYFDLPKCSKLNKTKNFKPSFNKIIKVYVHYSDLTLILNNNTLKNFVRKSDFIKMFDVIKEKFSILGIQLYLDKHYYENSYKNYSSIIKKELDLELEFKTLEYHINNSNDYTTSNYIYNSLINTFDIYNFENPGIHICFVPYLNGDKCKIIEINNKLILSVASFYRVKNKLVNFFDDYSTFDKSKLLNCNMIQTMIKYMSLMFELQYNDYNKQFNQSSIHYIQQKIKNKSPLLNLSLEQMNIKKDIFKQINNYNLELIHQNKLNSLLHKYLKNYIFFVYKENNFIYKKAYCSLIKKQNKKLKCINYEFKNNVLVSKKSIMSNVSDNTILDKNVNNEPDNIINLQNEKCVKYNAVHNVDYHPYLDKNRVNTNKSKKFNCKNLSYIDKREKSLY